MGISLLLAASFSSASARGGVDSAQVAVEIANNYWHLAGVSEAERHDPVARAHYLEVIDAAAHCEKHIRRWFMGASYVALARIGARMGDTLEVEQDISHALEQRFWNWDIIRLDPVLAHVLPKHWVDSTITYWKSIKEKKSLKWHVERPIMLYPNGDSTTTGRALIIALHGGTASYREFAEHWRGVADSLGMIIAIPAGTERYDCSLNSWSDDFEQADQVVMGLLDSLTNSKLKIDPKRVIVAGFSQGAQVSLKIALVHPDRFKGAILLSGYMAMAVPTPMLTAASEAGLRIYAESGALESASLVNSITYVERQASQARLPFEFDRIPGNVHEMPVDLTARMNAIVAWLERPVASVPN